MAEEMIDVTEVEESVETTESNVTTIAEAKEQGISSQEIKMGLDSGVIAKEDKTKEDKTEEDKTEELNRIRNDINEGKDLSEDDEQRVHKDLSKDEKGFYFKAKKERKQRQAIQQHNELIQKTLEASNRKAELLQKELEKYKSGDHFVKGVDEKDEDDFITKGDLEARDKRVQEDEGLKQADWEVNQAAQASQSAAIEAVGAEETSKNSDFPRVVNLVQEVASQDTTGQIINNIDRRAAQIGKDPEAQQDFIDYIYRVAKRHSKFNDIGKTPDKEKIELAHKASKNASKSVSSASIPSGGGRKLVSENDLTPEEGARLSNEKWMKLKPETQRRLLMG